MKNKLKILSTAFNVLVGLSSIFAVLLWFSSLMTTEADGRYNTYDFKGKSSLENYAVVTVIHEDGDDNLSSMQEHEAEILERRMPGSGLYWWEMIMVYLQFLPWICLLLYMIAANSWKAGIILFCWNSAIFTGLWTASEGDIFNIYAYF